MPVWLVSLLSATVGAGLAYLGSLHLRRLEQRNEERRERQRALAGFLGRLYIVVAQLRDTPPNPPLSIPERLQEKVAERSPRVRAATWVRTQRELQRTFGDAFREPMQRLTEAYARLQLLSLDRGLRQQVEETMNYLDFLSATRTDEAKNEWPDVRRALLTAIEEAGDGVAIRAAESIGDPSISETDKAE